MCPLNCLNPRSFEAIVLKAPYAKAPQVNVQRRFTGDETARSMPREAFTPAHGWSQWPGVFIHIWMGSDLLEDILIDFMSGLDTHSV